jgi:hypothetical protein
MGTKENLKNLGTARSEYQGVTVESLGAGEQAATLAKCLRALQKAVENVSLEGLAEDALGLVDYAARTTEQVTLGHAALGSSAEGLHTGPIHEAWQNSQNISERVATGSDLQQSLGRVAGNVPPIIEMVARLRNLIDDTLPHADKVDAGYEVITQKSESIIRKLDGFLNDPAT